MADDFDPYREALVMEAVTIWPEQYEGWTEAEKRQVEARLHADPQEVAELGYIRQHTGFRRQITVTAADLERLGVAISD
jgi:hypothetical protein